MPNEKEIEQKLGEWLEWKRNEQRANQRRLEIEQELGAMIPAPAEGSRTQRYGNFRVTTTQPISYRLDVEGWQQVACTVPEKLWPVKTETKLVPKGYKWLEANSPDVWKKVARVVTAKAGKIGWKVEVVD